MKRHPEINQSLKKKNIKWLALGTVIFAAQAMADNVLPDPALLAKGAYVAKAADCNACHRGASHGAPEYSGGFPLATPMGNIIGTNITPSKTHGIGNYTEEEFKKALTQGIRPDGTQLYPAMPYTAYQGMKDEDIHALWLWLQHGVEAVDKPVAQTALSFPWSVRPLIALWDIVNNTLPQPVVPLSTPELERGYYLVEVLGHCSACHSPRNFMLGEGSGQRFSGGKQGGWHAPNITSDPVSGVGGWRDAELIQYLKTGNVPGKGTASGGMAEAIEHSLQYLSDEDLKAIVAWLRQIPPVRDPNEKQAAWKYSARTGVYAKDVSAQSLYERACASCHRSDGQGAYNNTFPSLSHNSTTGSTSPENLVMVILDGVQRQGAYVATEMPGFRDTLSDEQIAQLTNYVAQRFGNPDMHITADFVGIQRAGGEQPALIRFTPWIAGIILIGFVAAMVFRIRRKRRVKPSRKEEKQ